jgi:12,18-didecarboxysiroheme deacetylase
MIGISKLYCGTVEASDVLRYGGAAERLPAHLLQFATQKKPVVVWNVTRRCNLRCQHCYAYAEDDFGADELRCAEGKALLDDLADFGVPVVLFSGGEPLQHPRIIELIAHARARGMRAVLSTNGTLITPEVAATLKGCDLSYAGISLDGLEATHDAFRGARWAFQQALAGIRHCQAAGLKVGLRFTITRQNMDEVNGIFDLVSEERIARICFYHLVYAGRGAALLDQALTHEETRRLVDLIIDRTRALHEQGQPTEVLTVDNHCDGPYLYLRLLRENPERADAVLQLLRMNGGNNTGIGIGCVSWDGTVHPDQFWRHAAVGNVRERPFSAIWTDPNVELLARLRDRKPLLHGRCAGCQWLAICNGNFRVRAEAMTGDLWAPDPACYLTDAEIGTGGAA